MSEEVGTKVIKSWTVASARSPTAVIGSQTQ